MRIDAMGNGKFSNYNKLNLSFYSKMPKMVQPIVDVNKKGLKRIDNATFAELSLELQNKLKNIHSNIKNISTKLSVMANSKTTLTKIKKGYENFLPLRTPNAYKFKLGDEVGNVNLSIIEGKQDSDRLRLVLEYPDGKEVHYLIDGDNKVVANLNNKAPHVLPAKFRYMTLSQIVESNIEKYITIAESELTKFNNYIETSESERKLRKIKKLGISKYPTGNESFQTSSQQVMQKAETPVKTETRQEILQSLSVCEILEKIKNIFETGPQNLPAYVDAKISPNSGNVLALSFTNKNGDTIKISKKISSDYGVALRYIQIEYNSKEGIKEFVNIDLLTNEILKTNPKTNKPKIIKNSVHSYSQAEIKQQKLDEKIQKWTQSLFDDAGKVGANVVVLEEKKPKDVENLDLEGITFLSNSLELDQIQPNLKTNKISKTLPHKTKETKRKPDLQKANSVNSGKNSEIINFINSRFAEFELEFLKKYRQEAQKLSENQLVTFQNEVQKKMQEKFLELKSKMESLFKK